MYIRVLSFLLLTLLPSPTKPVFVCWSVRLRLFVPASRWHKPLQALKSFNRLPSQEDGSPSRFQGPLRHPTWATQLWSQAPPPPDSTAGQFCWSVCLEAVWLFFADWFLSSAVKTGGKKQKETGGVSKIAENPCVWTKSSKRYANQYKNANRANLQKSKIIKLTLLFFLYLLSIFQLKRYKLP